VPRLLAFSDAANLGLHAMLELALAEPKRPTPVAEVAARLDASEAHLGKVLQRLGRLGLVASRRGPKGGFTLGRPPEEISLGDVVTAIDGPLDSSGCLLGHKRCLGSACLMGGVLDEVFTLLSGHLSSTLLSHLVERRRLIDGSPPADGAAR